MDHFAETPRCSVSAGAFAGEVAPPARAPSGPEASFGAEVVTPAGMRSVAPPRRLALARPSAPKFR